MKRKRIEDFGLIGDLETAALVSSRGAIEWLCLPDFDSSACFAALLGSEEHGHWTISPVEQEFQVNRSYRGESLILVTEFATPSGRFELIDFMPLREESLTVVRTVRGLEGQVATRMQLALRLDYGRTVPLQQVDSRQARALAGPHGFLLNSDVPIQLTSSQFTSEFKVSAGQEISFALQCYPSHRPEPKLADPRGALQNTERFWREWIGKCNYQGAYRGAVVRSLLTLKALTSRTSGGMVAAATSSLPENLGGSRNWDYRCCWIRDATFVLEALLNGGYTEEARAWRDWLLRAIAGNPHDIQPMYGLKGQRHFVQWKADWLPGFAGSRPVRIGNGAASEVQHDMIGEIADALHHARCHGLPTDDRMWEMQKELVDYVSENWRKPDAGIWEMRGAPQHFTHSKVMSWVAVDRALEAARRYQFDVPWESWTQLRSAIRQDIHDHAFDQTLGAFTQAYGSELLDAATLLIPLVGFLPATDPRMRGTIAAIEQKLMRGGLVHRYDATTGVDGLSEPEGALLMCSFWLADNYILLGRYDEAIQLFDRLLALRNDLGLLSEEYDTAHECLVGNFPQAFSHVALINTAHNLSSTQGRDAARHNY